MSNKRITILKNQLSQIELFIPLIHKKNPKVSKSSSWRTILFPIGYFPRGKARAPKYVLPPEIITLDDLNTQLLVAKENINTLNSLNKAMYFKHPIFGMLAKKQTLRFLEMHTNHHLKIINDILKN